MEALGSFSTLWSLILLGLGQDYGADIFLLYKINEVRDIFISRLYICNMSIVYNVIGVQPRAITPFYTYTRLDEFSCVSGQHTNELSVQQTGWAVQELLETPMTVIGEQSTNNQVNKMQCFLI